MIRPLADVPGCPTSGPRHSALRTAALFGKDERVLVVLDTNVFYTDVRANGLLLRSMLDDALPKGAFELFVPEVVLRELDKQFAQRSKKVVREVNKALGAQEEELRRLGIQAPPPMVRDDADIEAYREALVKRLTDAGAEVLDIPEDLSPALDWAVNRRKPFKDSGDGFPDAVIWLSVLDLALAREDEIVLISNNSGDFAVKKDSDELAEELRGDLVARGRPAEQVRLTLSLRSFAEEIGVGPAKDAVAELAADGAFFEAIENAIMYSPVDPAVLDRPIELDNDPQVTGWDLEELTVESAVELPGGRLVADCTARASLELDLLIAKADYYGAPEDLTQWLTLSNGDFTRHYVEAQTSVELDIQIEITTNKDGSGTQAEIGDMSLTPVEVLRRVLHTPEGITELLETLRPEVVGQSVSEFVPTERLETPVEEATVSFVYPGGSARLEEVLESADECHVCQLDIAVEADVAWNISAPSPFDVELFKGLVQNEESDAPILQGEDSRVPLTVGLTGAWDPEHGWHHLEISEVAMTSTESRRRSQRLSAAQEKLLDEQDPEE